MQIVPQFAVFSYCALPCQPMLPAPRTFPMLPAPKFAGLLTAGDSPRKVSGEVIFEEQPLSLEALERAAGPFLTIEEMDAEIAATLANLREAWMWPPHSRARTERVQ